MDGFGSINWWGFSPAIDFGPQLFLKDANKADVNAFAGNDVIALLAALLTCTYMSNCSCMHVVFWPFSSAWYKMRKCEFGNV